jgi:hypothetical protein
MLLIYTTSKYTLTFLSFVFSIAVTRILEAGRQIHFTLQIYLASLYLRLLMIDRILF